MREKRTRLMIVVSTLLVVYYCGEPGRPASGKGVSSLKEVGCLDFGPAYDVVVVHKTAYVTGNRGVHIIDVENPVSPRELGRLKLQDGAFGISVRGHRAYIAGDSEGFFIADIADPKNPVVIGQYSPKEGLTEDVSIDGTLAYVIKREGRLLVLDITNESKPLLLGELPVGSAGREAIHQEDRLYLADSSWGLVLLDVSDPSSPLRVSVVPGTEGASGIAFKTSWMFLACHRFGLKILDVSAAARPQVKGTFRFSSEANAVLVDNDDLYVAGQNDGTIHVLDVKDPLLPVIVTSRKGYMPHRLFHDGDYLYAADGKHGLVIFQYVR